MIHKTWSRILPVRVESFRKADDVQSTSERAKMFLFHVNTYVLLFRISIRFYRVTLSGLNLCLGGGGGRLYIRGCPRYGREGRWRYCLNCLTQLMCAGGLLRTSSNYPTLYYTCIICAWVGYNIKARSSRWKWLSFVLSRIVRTYIWKLLNRVPGLLLVFEWSPACFPIAFELYYIIIPNTRITRWTQQMKSVTKNSFSDEKFVIVSKEKLWRWYFFCPNIEEYFT